MTSLLRIKVWRIIALFLLCLVLISIARPIDARRTNSPSISLNDSINFFPLTMKNYPWEPVVGSQINNLGNASVASLAVDAGVYWARLDAFNWSKIEPQSTVPPTYDWQEVNEKALVVASDNGFQVIAIIRSAPGWARKLPTVACGPIHEDSLDEFADFLFATVSRYSVPPYNVKYWELGNEPDIDPSLVSPDSVFGCWGDKNDPYYGGRYYSEMLKVAYPAIKAADPNANVLIGGLLMDCDPTNPPDGKDCLPSNFFEGILVNGGEDYFDIVSYHGYPPYSGPSSGVGALYLDEHFPGWENRGGVVLGKLDFIKYIMKKFEVVKPIFHTEGSLICPEWNTIDCLPPGDGFEEAQADYVVWLFVRNWANGVKTTSWYQFEGPGWRFGGLLDENQNPKLPYYALVFLSQELQNAKYIKRVTDYTDVVGYEFKSAQKKIWVMWSPDENPHSVSLPNSVLYVFDKFGNEITLTDNEIIVDSPVYIEFAK